MKAICNISLLLIALLISCNEVSTNKSYTQAPLQLRTIDFGKFKIGVPGRWERFYLRDNDSIEAGITNGEDTIIFKYAKVVPVIDENEEGRLIYKKLTIDGFNAKMSFPEQATSIPIKLTVEGFKDRYLFYAEGRSTIRNGQLMEIFCSLQFRGERARQMLR